LGSCPEFEILPPVVLAHAVAVMDGFLRKQMTPEDLFPNLVSGMLDSADVGSRVRSFGHIRHMFSLSHS
jgi:hypothetical protein